MKQLTEEYFDYIATVYGTPLDPRQYDEMEKSFMAGAGVVMMRINELGALPKEEAIEGFEDMEQQFKEFLDNLLGKKT